MVAGGFKNLEEKNLVKWTDFTVTIVKKPKEAKSINLYSEIYKEVTKKMEEMLKMGPRSPISIRSTL